LKHHRLKPGGIGDELIARSGLKLRRQNRGIR